MKLSTRLTLAMIALVAVTASAVGVLVHREIETQALPRALERLDLNTDVISTRLEASVHGARGDVSTQGRGIEGLVLANLAGGIHPQDGTAEAQWRGRVESRFVAELQAKPHYAQFRLIGIADGGREIVRVDRLGPGDAVRVVPTDELQRKGDQNYFASAIALAAGQVYVSPIELNREHAGIQEPGIPTLRVAAPIFGPNQQPFGILIVNLDMSSIFAEIRSARQRGDIYVVNERGDYLIHPDASKEFGFERGRPLRIQDDFPEFAELLKGGNSEPRIVDDRTGTPFGMGWSAVSLAGGPRVSVVNAIPYSRLLSADTLRPPLVGALLVVLIAAPLAWLLGRSLTRPLRRMTDAVEQFGQKGTLQVPMTAGGEIGMLAQAFNHMAAHVQEKTAALEAEIDERRRIFDTSIDLILITDRQGTFVRVSPSSKTLLGYDPEDMKGRNAAEFIHADDLEPTRNQMRLVRRGRHMRNFDTRYIHADGHIVSLTWTGVFSEQAQKYYFIGRDMTEQKLAEAALRESEQLARGIVQDALDAIIQVNERGEVVEWNPRAEAMFGWSREEAVGRPIANLYLPKGYRPRYLDMNERLREADIAAERFEFVGLRKDGTSIKVEVSMTGVRRRGGNVFNLFLRDITQKLAAEEQLRQAQKMEAVGQLTGGIAHDFNNMLTVITGTIDILTEEVAHKPQLAAVAKLISEAAARGAALTKHLLAFARKQPLNPQKTDINTLIVDTAKMLRPMLGEQIEIESVLRNDVWAAVVDSTQLTTAVVNLAVNARDAMPGGGKLTIETKNVVLDEGYAALNRDAVPGNYVMIAVSDTGTGIPAEMLDKIFEPFFSTKEVGKGTGLGLSMVYGFVKQSGGHIKVYSEQGHGTSFKIYLPSTTEAADDAANATPGAVEGGSETVLIVEDDPLVRNYVTGQLKSLGYQTICAADGNEALKLVDSGAEFDLLFTDVIMPSAMNGRQLADEMAKRRPSIKVLYTSGYTEDAIVHHGRLDPGVLLLPKPYRKSDLARMVREALSAPGGSGNAARAG